MPLARSRLRIRRAEFVHGQASLNLIPLIDILTAIVFFSLLSVVGLRSALASFDLVQPPAVAGPSAATAVGSTRLPEVVVRIDADRFVVRHSAGESLISRRGGPADPALLALRRRLTDVTRPLSGRAHVTVVPSDDVVYDDLVRVLDEVQRVTPGAVSLGTRARRPAP
jgi:biopolymer transport protein ExbD